MADMFVDHVTGESTGVELLTADENGIKDKPEGRLNWQLGEEPVLTW